MATPYQAAVRVLPTAADEAQDGAGIQHTGPIVIEVIIRLQQDGAAHAPSATVDRAPMPEDAQVEPLTKREQEVLGLLALGLSNREIAERLVLAESTTKQYVKHIMAKLGVNRRVLAAIHPQAQALRPPKHAA